jgi:hypothetical protein
VRPVSALIILAVLGASCTGDRPVPSAGHASSSTPEKPVCDRMPTGVPTDFMLVRTREVSNRDYVATRREYRDAEDRLLVYLLGVPGEIGEGAPVVEKVGLTSGMEATLLGGSEESWVLAWKGEFPCRQMSIVGNGFSRVEFETAMREIGLLGGG